MILGIDVSKDKLDIFILPSQEHLVIKNTQADIQRFFKNKMHSSDIQLVIFEATGSYEKWLHVHLLKTNIPHHKAHPTRVYHFAQAKGRFAKTDKIDALILAQYAQQEKIEADEIIQENQLKIQEYSARRIQLKEMLAQETQRLKTICLDKEITRSIKRSIKQLQQELALITKKLDDLINTDETTAKKRAILRTAKGIGEEVSSILVTNLPELGKVSREEISHLVGVAPQTKDSGRKLGYRAVSHGRFHVRKALYMSALVAVRHDNRMKQIYDKLIAKGKCKKVALVAVMRKLIIMLNAMVKNLAPWQSQSI